MRPRKSLVQHAAQGAQARGHFSHSADRARDARAVLPDRRCTRFVHRRRHLAGHRIAPSPATCHSTYHVQRPSVEGNAQFILQTRRRAVAGPSAGLLPASRTHRCDRRRARSAADQEEAVNASAETAHTIISIGDKSGQSTFHTFSIDVTPPMEARPDPATPAAGTPSFRTWTDSTGTYQVRARFVKIADGVVQFAREDGRSASVPLERLSEADQKIARELAAAAQSR